MAAFVEFRGYGVNGSELTVDVERVTHFYSIDYNGWPGVELALEGGATVRVNGFRHDVEQKIKQALAAKEPKA